MRRRRFLRGAAGLSLGTAAGLSGCLGVLETRSARTPPLPEDRPEAVYFPSHVEGMTMVGQATATPAGDRGAPAGGPAYRVAVMYSYPHRFWTVTGTERSKHSIGETDLHLMTTVWDPETGTVVPETGVDVEITRDGELVSQEVVYPMLSQPMGFHYGGNFTLDGDGTYAVRVSVAGTSIRRTGAFAGRFGDPASATVPVSYSAADRDALPYEITDDRAGSRAAVAPRQTETPRSVAPAPGALPGRLLGQGRVGDAVFVATLTDPPTGVDGDGPYLLVSPRTPYNRTVLPAMGLRATVDGADRRLVRTLDPEAGYHYGTTLPATPETVTVRVETPAQVARHEGYETAFLATGETTLSVD